MEHLPVAPAECHVVLLERAGVVNTGSAGGSLNGIPIVTPEFVQRAHANGLAVHVWTINDAQTMQWLVDIGVDGIMTDRPTLLEGVLGANRVKYRPRVGRGPRRAGG